MIPLRLNADSSLYDIQFESGGTTYVMTNQTLPLELTVSDDGTGSLDDILKNYVLYSPQYSRYSSGSGWNLSMNCPIWDMYAVSLDSSTGTSDAYRLTISSPFGGYAELSGEYEATETYWDPALEEDVTNTYTTSFSLTISILNYSGPGSGGSGASASVGQVIGADGNFYADADDALMAGTTAEAMVAYIDTTTGTGLAIALEDVYGNGPYPGANSKIQRWINDHPVSLGTWRMPSAEDWMRMFEGCVGDAFVSDPAYQDMGFSSGSINTMLFNAGGDEMSGAYFTSTTYDDGGTERVWRYNFDTSVFQYVATGPSGRSGARACLEFEVPAEVVPYEYAVWAAANGRRGNWSDEDADGIANVFRYVFDVPSGAFSPITNITFNAAGKAVVSAREVVHTSGFTLSVVASDDIAGTENVASYPISFDGQALIDEPRKPRRFFRLKAGLDPDYTWMVTVGL